MDLGAFQPTKAPPGGGPAPARRVLRQIEICESVPGVSMETERLYDVLVCGHLVAVGTSPRRREIPEPAGLRERLRRLIRMEHPTCACGCPSGDEHHDEDLQCIPCGEPDERTTPSCDLPLLLEEARRVLADRREIRAEQAQKKLTAKVPQVRRCRACQELAGDTMTALDRLHNAVHAFMQANAITSEMGACMALASRVLRRRGKR